MDKGKNCENTNKKSCARQPDPTSPRDGVGPGMVDGITDRSEEFLDEDDTPRRCAAGSTPTKHAPAMLDLYQDCEGQYMRVAGKTMRSSGGGWPPGRPPRAKALFGAASRREGITRRSWKSPGAVFRDHRGERIHLGKQRRSHAVELALVEDRSRRA